MQLLHFFLKDTEITVIQPQYKIWRPTVILPVENIVCIISVCFATSSDEDTAAMVYFVNF